MPGQSGYNSLETLLLFQHLWSYGVSLQVFTRISDQLKNDADVRAAPDFDPTRLAPDALKDHFVKIIHDEAKASNQEIVNGTQPSSPRKRKAPSPTLPTLQDVAKNLDLMPKLILKLYSRCREQLVSDIREAEQKFAKADADIAAIKRGDWDAKIQDGLAEGEKLKTTVNGDGRKSSNQYTQRTPSPTSTTIVLPRTVPRPQPQQQQQQQQQPQLAMNQPAGARQPPTSYSQPPHRTPYAQPSPSVSSSKPSKSPSIPPSTRPNSAQLPTIKPGPQTPYASGPQPSARGGMILQPFQVSPQIPSAANRQTQLQPANPQPLSALQSRMHPTPNSPLSPHTPHTPAADPGKSRAQIMTVTKSLADPNLLKKPAPTVSRVDTPKLAPSPLQVRAGSPINEPPPTRKSKQDKLPASARGVRASRRTRGASAASSVVESSARGRTRSQSIISQASADETASNAVKNEPASTPMGSDMLGDETPMQAPPRRGASTRSKRKRSVAASEASAPDLPKPTTETEKMILAVRNFARVSSGVLHSINQHKYAGLFQKPVQDKDAKGYSTMILRPTDLKTIKTAITSGGTAIKNDESANAALSASGSSATSRDAAALLLPWSEDLVPPKSIVNSAQFEKEVMRMFANAVMFNPGVYTPGDDDDDSVVRQATEMFDETSSQLIAFREAEKGAEQEPLRQRSEAVEEEPTVSTPVQTSQASSKRRKVA